MVKFVIEIDIKKTRKPIKKMKYKYTSFSKLICFILFFFLHFSPDSTTMLGPSGFEASLYDEFMSGSNKRYNTGVPQQTAQQVCKTCLNLFRLVQTCLNLFKLD